ncbi:3-methyl-2-oxobutanoate hydroxymethyltransferase [Streptomyces albidoflavus]
MSAHPKQKSQSSSAAPLTLAALAKARESGTPLVMVTAYDYPSAQIVEQAGVDLVLVGDSGAMTVLGYPTTVEVSVEEMLILTSAVRRGLTRPLLVGDLPFGSYEKSDAQAVATAQRFVKEAGCAAVKLEGGTTVPTQRAQAIVESGIPTMGHVGLTPQTATQLGGFKAQGLTAARARQVLDDALRLQEAGCFALVLDVETMRDRLHAALTDSDRQRKVLDRQTADLRRSNEELEQFAYVASHDLQEPLRKIASFCQLLERRYAAQLDDRARQYIGYAVDGAQRMQTLINDLLEFSRVGRLHTDSTTVDLDILWTRTTEQLSIAVEESGATVTASPLPAIQGDATQLGMLLQNLLTNALKFRHPDHTPHISLTATRTGPATWTFSITDNGIGVGEEYRDRIFVIFQRLHTREEYAGNGIGLALCKKIVEFHGGTIALDLHYTPGARFTFTLPEQREPEEQQDSASRNGAVRLP